MVAVTSWDSNFQKKFADPSPQEMKTLRLGNKHWVQGCIASLREKIQTQVGLSSSSGSQPLLYSLQSYWSSYKGQEEVSEARWNKQMELWTSISHINIRHQAHESAAFPSIATHQIGWLSSIVLSNTRQRAVSSKHIVPIMPTVLLQQHQSWKQMGRNSY